MKYTKGFLFYFSKSEHDELRKCAYEGRISMAEIIRQALQLWFYEQRKLEMMPTTQGKSEEGAL